MTEYRVYCLDRDGMAVDVQSIAATNDEEAIKQAKSLEGLRQCEVWRGKRLIATITEFDTTRQLRAPVHKQPEASPSTQ
jgi:hypothetical protein